jgi:hypothetical protein
VGHPWESSSLDRKTCTANSGARTRQRTTAQHDSVTKIALLSIDCDNSDGSRLDATFNLSKRFFGDQHIDMTLENRGITTFVQSRLHIVSSLIVPS